MGNVSETNRERGDAFAVCPTNFANDNDSLFGPDLGMRLPLLDLTELTRRRGAPDHAAIQDIAAHTLRGFYLLHSALVTIAAAYLNGPSADATMELDLLARLFWATQTGALDAIAHASTTGDEAERKPYDGDYLRRLTTEQAPRADRRRKGHAANANGIRVVVDNTKGGGQATASSAAAGAPAASPPPGPGERMRASYWIKNGFPPSGGRKGQVFVSFSSENEGQTRLVKRLCSHLEPVLGRAGLEQPYVFNDPLGGARYGVSFLDEIVERIVTAPAAFIFKSADYFASSICRELELPLLLWRNRTQGMPLYLIYAGANAFETMAVTYPTGSDGGIAKVVLGELGDDRKAHPNFDSVVHLRDQPLQMLLDDGKFGAIDARLLATVADMVRALKLPRF